ncbi:MAG: sensor histidine kinase [Oceanicaulis sp.]
MNTIDTDPNGAAPSGTGLMRLSPRLRRRIQMIAVLTGFVWGAYAVMSVLNAMTDGAAPDALWRSLAADAFGAALSASAAFIIGALADRSLVWRIVAAVALALFATGLYCLAALPLVAPLAPPTYLEKGPLEFFLRLMVLNAWVFVAHAGLFVMLDQTASQDALSPERTRFEAARAGVLGVDTGRDGLDARWFWSFQAVFWSGMALFSIANTVNAGDSPLSGWRILLAESAGLAASTAAHYFVLHPTRTKPLPLRAAIALGCSVVMCAIYVVAIFSAFYLVLPLGPPTINGEPVKADLTFFLLAAPRWMFLNFPVYLGWSGFYLALDSMRALRRQERQLYRSIMFAQDSQLKMLRFQLNPHFLFNTLNAVSSLLMDKRAEDADLMVNQLARFLRHTLDATPGDEIALSEEMAAQRLYLEIEKARFQDRLDVEIDVAAECLKARAPMLILQPLLENAIKYAVARSIEPVKIRLAARRAEDGRLELSVTDTGPKPDPGPLERQAEGAGVGLRNIQARLSTLYADHGTLTAGPTREGGFEAVVRLPFRIDAEREETF